MSKSIFSNIVVILLALSFVSGLVGLLSKQSTSAEKRLALDSLSNQLIESTKPGIGLVEILGPIQMSNRVSPMFSDPGSSEAIVKALERALTMDNIKAVIVRINSPGGTVAASQEIYNAIWNLRQQGKYTVASLGDIAASGGYYIASACDTIYSNKGTLTGSIGVILNTLYLEQLYKKIGVDFHLIKSGEYKDILSSSRAMTIEEIAMLQKTLDTTYQQFISDVAQGRKQSEQKVKSYAEGQIYSGSEALELGLVDALGDFSMAASHIHEKMALPGERPHIIPLSGLDLMNLFSTLSGSSLSPWQHFIQTLNRFFAALAWVNPSALYSNRGLPQAVLENDPSRQNFSQPINRDGANAGHEQSIMIQYLYRP